MGSTASQDTTKQALGVVGAVMGHWAEMPFRVKHGQFNMSRHDQSNSTYLASQVFEGAKWAIALVVGGRTGRGRKVEVEVEGG